MADLYGNPDLKDYLALKQGLSAMKASREDGRYKDAQEGLIEQHGTPGGVVENVDPSNLNKYQLKAYKGFADGYNSAMDAHQTSGVNTAKSNIMAGIKKAGDPFSFFSTFQPSTEAELQASAQIREGYAQNSNFQKQMFKNRAELAQAKGEEAISVLSAAEGAVAKGDVTTAGRLLEGMTRSVPMRGRYEFDENTGTMRRMYLSREEGWVDTGETMTVQELMGFAKGFTQEEFSKQVALHMRTTNKFNREEIMQGGKEAVGPNGENFKVYAQVNPQSFEDVDYIVFQDGKQVGAYRGNQLFEAGIQIRNMDQEKAQADLDYKGQQIATSQQQQQTSAAAQDAHEASAEATRATMPMKVQKAQADLTKAIQDVDKGNLEAGRKALADLLMPFQQKGTTGIDFNTGQLTTAGNNALNDAHGLVQKAQAGEPVDPVKLESAQSALKLYQKLQGQHAGKYGLKDSQEIQAIKGTYNRMVNELGWSPEKAKQKILESHPEYRELLTGKKQSAMRPH